MKNLIKLTLVLISLSFIYCKTERERKIEAFEKGILEYVEKHKDSIRHDSGTEFIDSLVKNGLLDEKLKLLNKKLKESGPVLN